MAPHWASSACASLRLYCPRLPQRQAISTPVPRASWGQLGDFVFYPEGPGNQGCSLSTGRGDQKLRVRLPKPMHHGLTLWG